MPSLILKAWIAFALIVSTFQVSAIEVLLRNAQFYAPEKGPYIETNALIVGSSVSYKPTSNGMFAGQVEVTMLIKQADQGVVIADKYILNTVEITDTNKVTVGIVDKKRYVLPNGSYVLEATFIDLVSGKQQIVTEPLIIDFNYNNVEISNIDLIDEYGKAQGEEQALYVRGNTFMTPYVVNFYPDIVDKLTFYAEVYNTESVTGGDQLLLTYAIKKHQEAGIPYGHFSQKKSKSDQVIALFNSFDISNLPSGNYDLVIEVRNRDNVLLAEKKMFFQRSKVLYTYNPDNIDSVNVNGTFAEQFSINEIKYQLQSMNPIASVNEARIFNKYRNSEDTVLLRKLFYNFWLARNDVDPYGAWEKYNREVQKVNYEFGTNLNYGFETDRGRIYLGYGQPSQVIDMPREPGAFPYQIWHYYGNVATRSNVKFVFYAPDLVTNSYELIHSTAQNEIINEDWERIVYKTFTGGNTPTDGNRDIQDHFGGRTSERFDE